MKDVKKRIGRWYYSVRGKFFLFFIFLSIIPILVISVLGYQMTRKIILRQSFRYLSLQNEVARNEVYRFLQESRQLISPEYLENWLVYHQILDYLQKGDIESLQRSGDVRKWARRIQDSGYFESFWIVDQNFNLAFSSIPGKPIPLLDEIRRSVMDSLVSVSALKDKSGIFFLCLHPVRTDKGEAKGYIIGEISQKKILESLPRPTPDPQTSRVYILRKKNEVLFCTSGLPHSPLDALRNKKLGPSRSIIATLPNGERVIRNVLPLGLLDWEVMSEIDYQVAMADVIQFRNRSLMGGAILVLLLFIMAIYMSRMFTRPVKELVGVVQKIGEGNLDIQVQPKSRDEIGQLAREFEVMRLKLKDYYENLEKMVNDRTEELQKAQYQIIHQEKMASLGLMAAGIAHEIGNPLTSISSLIQMLRRRNQNEEMREYLDTILENIQRISKIVRQLVDFSRPTSDQPQSTDVNSVIRSAVGIIKFEERAKNINFHVDLDQNLPLVKLIPDQLQQVIINILVNAIDAMESSGEDLYVQTRKMNHSIQIKIKDTGIGIPKEHVKRIFEPFFTTKEVGKGTGLGLTVSYGIVKKFGGDIRVESTPGKGTEFTIILPVKTEEIIHET